MSAGDLGDVLLDIEVALWELGDRGQRLQFTDEQFRACVKVFSSAMMDRMWTLMEKEQMSVEDREKMAFSCGDEIRRLVKIYTDTDTLKLYGLDE